jgi:PPK2 family polyphosphate:nucleotide phosphotransferase
MTKSLSVTSTTAPKGIEKKNIKDRTAHLLDELKELQKILFAQSKYSVLIILQGLDASGKDGVINKVFSGLNPLGVDVTAFKAPTEEELKYDFLWRVHKEVPSKGEITIFNRSHYEDVLVPVVEKLIDERTLRSRYDHINNFEKLLTENYTLVLKYYLHISKEVQLERLRERKTNPEKYWKHNDGDWETSKKWEKYMNAYHDVFKNCNTPHWTIVPSDLNWYKEYVIAESLLRNLKKLDLKYPKLK